VSHQPALARVAHPALEQDFALGERDRIGDVGEPGIAQHLVERGKALELGLLGVEPDAEEVRLAARHPVLQRPFDGDDDVVGALDDTRRIGRVGLDRAEQGEVGAGKARGDRHFALAHLGDEPLGQHGRYEQREQHSEQQPAHQITPDAPITAVE
jgi:hypothetical protein